MAFTNQLTTNTADLISKLNTFLSANGWTTHHVPASGEFAAEKNPSGSTWITMAVQWDTSTPRNLGIYQWHGATYNSGASPWAQNNDSGNGAASTSNATISGNRRAFLGTAGAPQEFWAFEDDDYCHVVVRYDTDSYTHFGFGLLHKFNDWTGGEYCYGQEWTDVSSNCAVQTNCSLLLDGLAADASPITNMEERSATLHIEGMTEQAGSEIWGVAMGNQNSANLGTDRGANDRIHILGGFRAGLLVPHFGQFAGTVARGLVPMYPILVAYWNRTNADITPLGTMQDVRGVSMRNFAAGDEITVGGDTWVVFPSRKRADAVASGTSVYQGIAYKQVA